MTGSLAWLTEQCARVDQVTTTLENNAITIKTRLAETVVELDRLAERVDEGEAARATRREAVVDVERALKLIAEGRARDLTRREARTVAALPHRMTALGLGALLRAHPDGVRHTIRACFANWEKFRDGPMSADQVLVIDEAASRPNTMPALDPITLRYRLATDGVQGPTRVARMLTATSIEAALHEVTATFMLRPSWTYTGFVLAEWLQLQIQATASIDAALLDIRARSDLSAQLLPAAYGDRTTQVAARSRRTTLGLQAYVTAILLRAANREPPALSSAGLAALSDHLIGSTFRDPRVPPTTAGWEEVRRLEPRGYDKFLARLIEQDLEVFFRYAMNEPDRRKFWLWCRTRIRRTMCILDAGDRDDLRRKLSASDELRGAIERAYTFAKSSPVSAFCLFFDQVVVVEFSDNGNAAYVYGRSHFEGSFQARAEKGLLAKGDSLKVKERALTTIRHQGDWQERALEWISEGCARP
jgi:EH_Signature domain